MTCRKPSHNTLHKYTDLFYYYYKSKTKSYSLWYLHFKSLAWGSWKPLQWTAWWNCSIVFQHSLAQSVLWGTESQSISECGRRVLSFFCIFPHRHCSRPGSGSAPWRHPRRHHLQHLQWEQIPFLQHQLQYRSAGKPVKYENSSILDKMHAWTHQKVEK